MLIYSIKCINIVNDKQLKQNKMKTTITTTQSTKQIMDLLMNCITDKKTSIQDKKIYYSEYLKLSAIYLIESK